MLTDDGYRQIMQHARRLAQGGRGELAQHLRDAIDLRAEVEALRADADRLDFLDTNLSRNFGWQVAIAPAGKLSVQSVAYPASPPVPIRFAIDAARAAQGERG